MTLRQWLNRRREAELVAMDEFRRVRKLAREDVTVLGEQLAELDAGTKGESLSPEALRHYQQALDAYEDAKRALNEAEDQEQVAAVETILVEARHQQASVLAVRAGEEPPERREECFFNPSTGRPGPTSRGRRRAAPSGRSRSATPADVDSPVASRSSTVSSASATATSSGGRSRRTTWPRLSATHTW